MPNRRSADRKSYIEEQRQSATWRIENRCQQWNAAFPVGTVVRYFPVVGWDANFTDTKTRSEAWVMGGDSLVVMLEGVTGCVACEQIRIRIEAVPSQDVEVDPKSRGPFGRYNDGCDEGWP